MMTIVKKCLPILLLVAALLLQACAMGTQLAPVSAEGSRISGAYDLILYGCRYADDVENIAILVDTGGPYAFQIKALDAMYRVEKNLPAAEALGRADAFIHCSMHPVWNTVLRGIVDKNGITIGYELKPLYRPWEFVVSETLLSSYYLQNGMVTARLELDPEVDKAIKASSSLEHDP